MKPLTSIEINQLDALMANAEQRASFDYGNRSGKFVNAKLIDADDEKFVIQVRSGIQSDVSNIVHHDIIVASRKHPAILIHTFEEETLSTL